MAKKKSSKKNKSYFISSFFVQHNRIIFLVVGLVILAISALLHRNKIFALSFVDEQSNMIMGYYVLQGEKIYGDIFQHHQPFTYIISAFLQKVTNPQSIYTLIQRHREFIILWSSIWSIILLIRYRFVVLPFIAIYEISKMYLFGNLFLRESLVVYPLLYLILYYISQKGKNKIDIFLNGLILMLPILMMSPIWPLCFTIFLLLFFKFKLTVKELLLMLLGGLPIILISLYFSSFKDYLYNIFYINFAYYIPGSHVSLFSGAIKGLFTPFLSFLPTLPNSSMLWIIRSLSLGLIIYSFFIIYKYKNYKLVFLTFVLLGIANLRYVQPGLEIYSGFHSLPWFALLILMVSYLFTYLWTRTDSYLMKIFYSSFIVLVFVTYSIFSSKILFDQHNLENDKFINYSRFYDYGEAINIMKSDQDTLFVIPDQRLLYWQAKIDHASKTVVYYSWMDSVPPIKIEIDTMFASNPPTFLYCKDCNPLKYPKYQVLYKHGKRSSLFVLKNKVPAIQDRQLDGLAFFGYSFRK